MATTKNTRCFLALVFAVVLLAMSSSAQVQIEIEFNGVIALAQGNAQAGLSPGDTAPKATFGAWLAGAPVPHGESGVTVYGFYTGKVGPQLSADGDYLSDLQRRFAKRSLRIVAVVGEDVTVVPGHSKPCSVVVDPGLATTQAWFGGEHVGADNVLVLDGDAQVTFRGRLGRGVIDAIERALAGKPKIKDEQHVNMLLASLEANFDSIVGAAAKTQLVPILRHTPRDGRALALAYLAAIKQHDAEAAFAQRQLAVGRLANESRPLAEFADLAMRGNPKSRELALELAAALVPATAAAPNDPRVQLAYLRALVLSRKSRQVGRQSMLTRKLVFRRASTCVSYCEILTQDEVPQIHRDLCEQAILKAKELGCSPRQLTALRYVVQKRCAEDDEAAKATLDAYVTELGGRDLINNDCWYFMTALGTVGRHDGFAAALADKMLEERKQMDSAEFDTAALAMFLAGRIAEAVELQESALAKGAVGNAEYVERLERYRAAAVAVKAPAKGAARGK